MQEEGGGDAELDGRTLESCFLVGAATFIMNAGVGACHCLNGGELMGPVHSAAPLATGAVRH